VGPDELTASAGLRFAAEQRRRARGEPWSADVAVCYRCASTLGRYRFGVAASQVTPAGMAATAVLDETHEGGPGVAHGAVVMALLDEVAGNLLLSRGHLCVTKTLTVAFRRPVPLHTALELAGVVESVDRHRWTLATSLRLPDAEEPLATGHGVWVVRGIEHWAQAPSAGRA